MKILIIQFRFASVGNADSTYDPESTKRIDNYLLPLGLAYISSYLKRAGKDVTVLNLNAEDGKVCDILQREITRCDYDIAFIGGLSMFYPHIKSTIQVLNDISPVTIIVVGGGIITAQPKLMLTMLNSDFGIVGEGEQTALELINCLEGNTSHGDIDGLVFVDGCGTTIVTRPRETILDLDALPYPDFEAFDLKGYFENISQPGIGWAYDIVDDPRPYPILGSRSCPYACTFCFHPLGKKYRQRSVDSIIEEIKWAVEKYNINIVNLYDELFSNDRDRVLDFCSKMKAYSKSLPYTLYWYCNCRVDTTTEEMVIAMKESGAYMVSFGLESASQPILDSMKKHTTPQQIETAIHLLRKHHLGLVGGFIFGDPAETCYTANETISFIKRNHRLLGAGCSFVFIIPFQGSPIYNHCVKYRIIPDEKGFIEERATRWFDYFGPLNMTQLTTYDFSRLKTTVFALQTLPYMVTAVAWCDNTHIEVRCPWCGEVSLYFGLPPPKGFETRIVGCRKCNYRYHLVSRWFPLKRILITLIGAERLRGLQQIKRGLLL